MIYMEIFINSIFEAFAIYCIVVALEPQLRLTIVKIVFFAVSGSLLTILLDYHELPYHMIAVSVADILIFFALSQRRFLMVVINIIMGIIVLAVIQFAITAAFAILRIDIVDNQAVIITLLITIAIAFVLCSRSRQMNNFFEKWYRKNQTIIFWFAIMALLLQAIIVNLFYDNRQVFFQGAQDLLLLFVAYITANIVSFIALVKMKVEKNTNKMVLEYGKILEGQMAELMRREHEHKGRLQAIYAIAEGCPPEMAKQDVMRYIDGLARTNKRGVYVSIINDSTLLSAYILNTKKRAGEQKIKFEYHIGNSRIEYPIEETDLIEILTNLMNNAFEELAGLPEEKRRVYMEFNEKSIRVANRMQRATSKEDIAVFLQEGYSTKGASRGFGLANIMTLAKQYGISLNTYSHDGDYVCELLFSMCDFTE